VSRPTEPVPTPLVVTDIAAGRPVTPVWVYELGGVTFAVDGGSEYVKVTPSRSAHQLEAEACRLGWADLVVAEWSLRYNYPDRDRMDHYLRLWEDGD
jgi:aminoglycoside phosphotransferase